MAKIMILSIMFLLLISSACASIDLSADKLDFNNVLAGKEYSKTITITSDSDANILVSARIPSELNSIVSVNPVESIVTKTYPVNLEIKAKADSGKKGVINICFTNKDMGKISTGSVQCRALSIEIIPGQLESQDISIKQLTVHPAMRDQSFDVELSIENKGNVDADLLLIAGSKEYPLHSNALNSEIIHIPVDNPYPEGRYMIPLRLLLGEKELFNQEVNFEVRKTMQHKLDFTIRPIAYADSKELNTLSALVKNDGEMGANANIKISVYKENKVIKSFEKNIFIGIGETKDISFEYMLDKGEYTIKGQAFYAGTYTDIVEQYLAVIDHSEPTGLAAGSIGIILLILVLFLYAQKRTGCSAKGMVKNSKGKKGRKRWQA